MDSIGREDIERLMFFEQAREAAEKEFKINNKDAMALTKWGGALLELAHFRQGNEAYEMIEEAIEKFKKALKLDGRRHDALWCLGNAYTSQGFLSAEGATANAYFTQAGDCFKKAVEQEPGNDSYKRALEMSTKAPSLYVELQRQLREHSLSTSPRAEPASSSRGAQQAKKPAVSELWWDLGGWATLLALGFGIAALSRTRAAGGAN